MTLDPRLHPYKPDIAAAYLKGKVQAERFVDGELQRICAPLCDLVSDHIDGSRVSQALYGEDFTVYQRQGDWCWGQLTTDGYVGWVAASALASANPQPATHRVTVSLTRATPSSIKVLGVGPLPMGALMRVNEADIAVGGSSASFAATDIGDVPSAHIAPLQALAPDWVSVAELFVGTPYVWGGRSALGLDCSALVQLALQQAGISALRDSDMQEGSLGTALEDGSNLQRGDLVFWPGHVGIMIDGQTLLHANAFAMSTTYEALTDVIARTGTPSALRRLIKAS
ncbi:MAG: C40 family peptidase [Pseudomonadota bacterium]